MQRYPFVASIFFLLDLTLIEIVKVSNRAFMFACLFLTTETPCILRYLAK